MPKYFVYISTAIISLLQLTSANFDLYHIRGVKAGGTFPGAQLDGWQIHNDNPTCDQVGEVPTWRSSDDVSHGYRGIRCEGKCDYDSAPWPDVKLIEMHFTNDPLYHFTIYKDKGHSVDGAWRWYLYGIDDSYGECFAWGDYNRYCNWPGQNLAATGFRKFRCISNAGADEINNARKKERGPALSINNTTTVA